MLKLSNRSLFLVLTIGIWAFNSNVNSQDMNSSKNTNNLEIATLGGGCFWCVEAIYEQTKGVLQVKPGYSGGELKNPTYKEVCTGRTGHAEVVQLQFDPAIISYAEILEIFWKTHDPTTLNRQGNDVGTHYRSVIFYHSAQQQSTALSIKHKLENERVWDKEIVTQLVPFKAFYEAEDYHDNYYANNPSQPYCSYVITPKVKKFEKLFEDYIK